MPATTVSPSRRARRHGLALWLTTASLIAALVPMTSAPAGAAEVDEGWIVFTRDPTPGPDFESGDEELWGMRADGSHAVRLTDTSCGSLTPDASPDARWVAWVEKCGSGQVDIYVGAATVTATGDLSLTSVRNITSFLPSGAERWPQFSPDGTKLAFIRKTNANFDIWRADLVPDIQGVPSIVNPVRVVRLGNDPMVEDCCVTWSPDGTKLVWASNVNKDSRSFDLYRVDSSAVEVWDVRTNVDNSADGSLDPLIVDRLTNQGFYEGTPAFDIDGTVLHRCNCPNGDIYRLNPITGVASRLTNHLELDRTPEGYPGGILYSRTNAGNDEVYAAGYNGQSPTNLTNNAESDRDPTWLGPYSVPPPDVQPPDAVINQPPAFLRVPFAPVTISGVATDDRSIGMVRIGVTRASDGFWLQEGGSWGPTATYLPATLGTSGAGSTAWSFTFQPGAGGDHTATVIAADVAGNQDPTPPTRSFTVTPSGPPDTTPPVAVVTSPENGQALPLGGALITGSATDNGGVDTVRITLKNNSLPPGSNWWNGSGWGSWAYVTATLSNPGGTSTNWTYTFNAPSTGSYGFQLAAVDTAGTSGPYTAWRNFSVT